MKPLAFALFVLWFLSLEFYLYVPGFITVALAVALVSTTTVLLAEWIHHRGGRVSA